MGLILGHGNGEGQLGAVTWAFEHLAPLQPVLFYDCWEYSIDASGIFSVSSLRRYIEGKTLMSVMDPVRWNKSVPLKVNIFSWRLAIDRLPTRCNLDKRGIDLDSTQCPLCDDGLESSRVDCKTAYSVWRWVSK
ncbi:reverse transcriptase zinc-binding domain-containing protein [Artemisia annua]|uniref:Reverse transcriptase zinc-binding domain-containing protein n=1 Tax=Artemisia annua TaxID=35608 RepID=A0A2U1QFR7_ARTAN|nr:reverse transcriptase zinc-binding domain-containing protein [Artemisia annua]